MKLGFLNIENQIYLKFREPLKLRLDRTVHADRWHEPCSQTAVQTCLLIKKKSEKCALPGLEPRHGQSWSYSLTTQLSLQVDAQQFFFFFF